MEGDVYMKLNVAKNHVKVVCECGEKLEFSTSLTNMSREFSVRGWHSIVTHKGVQRICGKCHSELVK